MGESLTVKKEKRKIMLGLGPGAVELVVRKEWREAKCDDRGQEKKKKSVIMWPGPLSRGAGGEERVQIRVNQDVTVTAKRRKTNFGKCCPVNLTKCQLFQKKIVWGG